MQITAATWLVTIAGIGGLLILDWRLLGRRSGAISFGVAVRWSLFYITVAVLFGVAFGLAAGWDLGSQYFAGYLVEKSLSVDNLFVFVTIIGAFAVPAEQQPRALSAGIVIALALRTVFIALGAALLVTFSVMFLIFGITLLVAAAQLYRHRDAPPALQTNVLVAAARRALPITGAYDRGRILTRAGGRWAFTPLLLVLLALGSTDVVFAFDSIPAVFGVTTHPFIVFAANAFALLGLRPLYFLVSGLLGRLIHLPVGLAAILTFIGAKLILEFAHHLDRSVPEISTGLSLVVIGVILAVTASTSLLAGRHNRRQALRRI